MYELQIETRYSEQQSSYALWQLWDVYGSRPQRLLYMWKWAKFCSAFNICGRDFLRSTTTSRCRNPTCSARRDSAIKHLNPFITARHDFSRLGITCSGGKLAENDVGLTLFNDQLWRDTNEWALGGGIMHLAIMITACLLSTT